MTGVGYTTVPEGDDTNSPRLRDEARQIRAACKRHGVALKKLVRDLEPQSGPDLRRPGLAYALESLEAGEFDCLVVPRLDRLTRSAANLGALIRLLDDRNARLIVVDIDLDTETEEGLERTRLEERTRKGLEAARDRRRSSGRPAVADRPSLKQRIADMRASGMTLQAIADTLNDEGIPTVRGGAEWRPSSVQAAAGYKRPSRRARAGGSPPKNQPGG
jgi:DNA invertase Pin-like site-specific DNA recombinase